MHYDVKIFQKNVQGFKIVKADKAERLIDVLEKNGILISAPCGGRGLCGKCIVKVKNDMHPIDPFEQEVLGLGRIKEGYRLACLYLVESDIEVYIEHNSNAQIMTSFVEPYQEIDPLVVLDNQSQNNYGVAFDIGTTTVVAYLINMKNGELIDSASEVNAQTIYGSDVVSRITYALENEKGLCSLKNAICKQISSLIMRLTGKNKIDFNNIKCVSIVGNTAMLHFLQGLDVKGLSMQPFNPVNINAVETNIKSLEVPLTEMDNCPVYILPCISSFAGADVTSAILVSGIVNSSKLSLLIDIGTNGELVLGNRERIISCSTAAGPAFEGAAVKHGTGGVLGAIDSVKISSGNVEITTIGNHEPVGICGSGIIDAVAELLKEEIVDETGKMNISEFVLFDKPSGENISITAKDIREIQLAKAAISAGINILLNEMGKEAYEVERVFIAGGFGNYINKDSMFRIGLLRNEFKNKVISIGNAAGAGAVSALLSKRSYYESISIAKRCEYLDLSDKRDFQDKFISNIFFKN